MRDEIRNLIDELRSFDCSIKLNDTGGIKLVMKDKSALPAELIQRVRARKSELIDYLQSATQTTELGIEQVEQQESYPISDAQRRLWVLCQFKDVSKTYNIPGSIRIHEPLDLESFKMALKAVIERHEILRTIFKQSENEEVHQWILDSEDLQFELDYRDLRGEKSKEEIAANYIEDDSFKEFDLEKGPLLRAALLQKENDAFVFYFNMHHIISDAWSSDILIREVSEFYESYKNGTNPQMKELDIQYKDYSVWQLKQLETESFQKHKNYWLNSLNGELPLLNLPSHKKRPVVKTNTGHEFRIIIGESLTENLRAYARKNNGSLFTNLLAAWNVLFYRYTGQNDIILGTAVAGREHKSLENQIGFYVNTLALRNQVHKNENFDDFSARVNENTLEALNHQMYPFDRLIEDLDLERIVNRSAVFDVMFAFHENNGQEIETAAASSDSSKVEDLGSDLSKFDMSITATEMSNALSIHVLFNPDVYEHQLIEQLMKHFSQVLSRLLENPKEELNKVNFLTEREEKELIDTFNSKRESKHDKTIVELFEEQVVKIPSKLAVSCKGRELSFEELNEVSNQFAHYLSKIYQVGKGDLVGIKLERSEWLIVSILGILKAGAAYVPIDPNYSNKRIEFIQNETSAKLCVDSNEIELFQAEKGGCSPANTQIEIDKDELAYVIYTSGSTGEPKGVMIQHKNVGALIQWSLKEFAQTMVDEVLFTTSINFDLSVFEIFYPLTSGKSIQVLLNGLEIPEYLNNEKKIMANTVPSVVGALLREGVDLSPIIALNMAGEPIPNEYKERLVGKIDEIRNLYGPSEDTTYTSCIRVDRDQRDLIGKPIDDTQIYILNDSLALQPIGVIGEICISGAGVSKGYLNKDELTAEKFIQNPFVPNTKCYRSGDMGRWLADGNLQFIGRRDRQVKIRGYRIELNEILIELLAHKQIANGYVTTFKNNDEKQLVAYYVLSEESALTIDELGAYLRKRLSAYMIPSHFVQLEEIPLTANGKIDEKSLPAPEESEGNSGAAYVAPTSDLEKNIVAIWEEILQKETIGLTNDFFLLGGHSLKALRLINEYQKSFDVKLSVDDLFVNTTVASHVQLIQTSTKTKYKDIPTFSPSELEEGKHSGFPISNAQRRIWVLSQFEEASLAYNMPTIIYLGHDLSLNNFRKAVHSVINRHEILRTVFRENNEGELRQWVIDVNQFQFDIQLVDLQNEENSQQRLSQLIQQDSIQPFDFEKGPLMRATLFQLGKNEFAFYYNVHHVISDGWSNNVLWKDTLEYYEALQENRSPNLEEMRIQYKEFSAWQLDQLNGESLGEDREYWLDRLSGELPVLKLPVSTNRPALQTNSGEVLQVVFSQDLSSRMNEFSSKEGGSLFMSLLSIWTVLMYKYTGQHDQIVGTPVSGRDHANLENQIGCYTNTLALRNQVNNSESFRSLYRRVRENTTQSLSHQMYPFDRLVEDLKLERDISRNPIFDVMLSVVIDDSQKKEAPDVSDQMVISHLGSALAKFDLDVTFEKVGGRLSCNAIFNSDLYASVVIEKLLRHFEVLANELLRNPKVKLDRVNYLTEEEVKQLHDFSCTETRSSDNKTFIDYFEEQVTKSSMHSALEFRDTTWSYQELNEKANHVASYLLEKYEIQPNDLVGIQLERSPWIIALMIGILKSDGAYLPIDSNYPKQRIRYMLEDSQAKLVFDQSELEELKKFKPTPVKSDEITQRRPSHLSYVMYTSGTTGRPKGVMIGHHSLVDYALTFRNKFSLSSEDRMIQQASIAFDTHVEEIYPVLLAGGTILMGENGGSDIQELEKLVSQDRATILSGTPLILKALNDAKSDLSNLRLLISGGDKFHSSYVSSFLGELEMYDSYGPTEATVCATYAEYTSERSGSIIGKPITNREIYILGDHQQLLPIGSIGEIYIGGEGLAIGYLNDSNLTREKFVDHLFGSKGKLYKSGDLGKWLSNGEIEFIGRKDDQVKIRGYRIELGEIETRIKEVPDVNEAHVVVGFQSEERPMLVGCVTLNDQIAKNILEIESTALRVLSESLPNYMVPERFLIVETIPVTHNGKVDKRKLLEIAQQQSTTSDAVVKPSNDYEERLSVLWMEVLKRETVSTDKGFFTLGGDSMKLIQLRSKIRKAFKSELRVADLYQYTTIQQQAEVLKSEQKSNVMDREDSDPLPANLTPIEQEDIAVIGMAIRAPKSTNIHEFWENIKNGKDLIKHFSREELLEEGVPQQDLDHPNYVRSNSYLSNKEYFDSHFFGYLPDEASLMNPQTRVFHEVVWSALEDAGINPQECQELIGLYAGATENTIWSIYSELYNDGKVDEFAASNLSNSNFANSLVAHKLNLKGPVHTITTACSTSLVTIHQASKSLLNGECHVAVAGGTSVRNTKYAQGYWHQEGMIYSKDGRNKTFDEDGSGTVGGEGSGAVVLKRLSDAIKDGDQIYAVIKGSAVNNDGDRKVGYTAPSVNGQAEVIQLAQRNAGVSPESISYVEAHGTATNLGDPVEVLGLTQAFGKSDKKYCALGSVKSNVGHLDSAAGVAGFIKTVLCLKNKQLVPSLHFETANPEINFENSPFFVNTETKEWSVPDSPLRAGVSSFGIGGTNAHIVLEEAPNHEENPRDEGHELIVLSAKSKASLLRQQEELKEFLRANREVNLTNVAWTLQNRAAFEYRLSFVAKTVDEAIDILNKESTINQVSSAGSAEKKTVFLFSGQGTQYENMGLGLYENEESTFRKTMDKCFEIASNFSDANLREIIYPSSEVEKSNLINQTMYTQPLLFIFEYALTAQLEDFGISPDIMMGHSIGEYVAACKAGVFSLEDAIKLVIKRGELMQSLPKGSMLAIGLSEKFAKKYVNEEIDIAAVNTPNSCVLSGPTEAIEQLAQDLEEEGIMAKVLHTSHAFHSSMMEPILDEFTSLVEKVEMHHPEIPYVSNLTGKVVTSDEWKNTKYWANQIRGAVRFSAGVSELLLKDNIRIIEVGPGDSLVNMARQHQSKGTSVELNSLIRHPKVEQDDTSFLLKSLSQMWANGLKLDWEKLIEEKSKRKISLPTYSFEKIKYTDGYTAYEFVANGLGNLNQEQRLDEGNWYYEPYWKPAKLRASSVKNESNSSFLVFCDSVGVGERLVELIRSSGTKAISILKGEKFEQKDESNFEINPAHFSDYEKLFKALKELGESSVSIIHLLSLSNDSSENVEEDMTLGYYSLLHIAKELQKIDMREEVTFTTITNRAEQVFGQEEIFPSKGMMSGINIVINQENQWAKTKMVDIDRVENTSAQSQLLWREVLHTSNEKQLAYRNGKRWAKDYGTVDLSMLSSDESAFKKNHTYLITGGLGGFGYMMSEYLITKYNANLILLGRTDASQLGERSSRLITLQSKGNVAYYSVDLADFSSTQKAIQAGEEEFGAIRGAIHAAGNVSGNSLKGINFLSQSECEEQFASKVRGTNILSKLLNGKELDFCLFTSSLASVIGGKEFGAYASANSYLDSFAHTGRIKNCVSINFDGLAVNGPSSDGTSLIPSEIIHVVEKTLLSSDDRQLAVSLTDLNERIERWVYPEIVEDEFIPLDEEDFQGFDRPALSNEYIEPETDIEKEVCQLLESFFGLNAIGVEDDFFELGGDSLKAMTVISRIHQKFDVQLQIREVMQNANVRDLSKEIDLRLKMREMEQMRSKTNFDNKIEL
ncbi:MAG: amino acid adenylation domain-containing protein [Crocinitomicaceae bacterium]